MHSLPRQARHRAPRKPLALAVSGALALGMAPTALADFPATVQLSALDGGNGFRLDGVAERDYAGSVSNAGDINGDGIDDLVIGAWRADSNGNFATGSSYVVFGRDTSTVGNYPATITLDNLNGANGFRLDGERSSDFSGRSVSAAGDINGDGIDDLIIGAFSANRNGTMTGTSYVVFGRDTSTVGDFPTTIALGGLNGTDGFRMVGAAAGDSSGYSVSNAGDINGDGIDDLIIGARRSNNDTGSGFVVFGRDTAAGGDFPVEIGLGDLTGGDGFRLDGEAEGDRAGVSVSAAGDINNDGIGDLIIGAGLADRNGTNSGSSYVVLGRDASTGGNFPATIALDSLDGMNGFRLDGEAVNDRSGYSVSTAGDINGDGIDDLIIGAWNAPTVGSYAGKSYVVFGRDVPGGATEFPAEFELSALDGGNGFRLDGVATNDRSGRSVSAAGDINGDGIDDLIIGAIGADPGGDDFAGSSYVVFGRDTAVDGNFSAAIALGSLDGSNGFRLDGEMADGQSGFSVSSIGDINGDAIDDLIIGAYRAGPFGDCGGTGFTDTDCSGRSYVVFGGLTGPGEVPAIGLTPMEVDFGNIEVGQTSLPQTVTLENTGSGGDLILDTLGLSGANAGDFALQNDGCSDQTVVPMATCTFEISFSPSAAGTRAAQVDIPSNAPTSPDTMGLNGTGTQGALAIAPDPVDFGTQTVGKTSASMSATLQNTGSADVNVGGVGAPAAPFAAAGGTCGAAPFAIAPAESCTLDFTFSPTDTGVFNDTISVTSDAPSSPDSFGLTGEGIQAAVELAPGALDFGEVEVGQPAVPQTVALTNTGTANLNLGALAISGANAGEFALSTSNDLCSNQTVAPMATCTFEISFSPSDDGARTAQVDIPSNAPTSPDTVGLAGTGVEAEVNVAPGALDFGEVEVGQPAAPQTVTLTNLGEADLNVGPLALSGTDAADFALQNDLCSSQTVDPAESCTFDITLTPSATGARTAQVDIPSNALTSPDTVGLNGNGIQGALTIAPDPVEFGTQAVGTASAAMSATLQNTGSADVNVDSVSAPGAPFNAAGGTCGTPPFAIAPASSCTLDFTFSPTTRGVFNAIIDVAGDSPSSPDSIGLQGEGVTSEVMLSANPFDFGAVVLGEGEPGMITLTNIGNQDLEVSDITDPGEPFTLDFGAGTNGIGGAALCTPPPFTLAPDANCAIEMLFNPASSGMFNATFDIVSNAPTSPDTGALVGSGVADGIFSDRFE